MRHMLTRWPAGWLTLTLILSVASVGCGKHRTTAPSPPPRLTSPRIAFASNRDGAKGIYLLNPGDGSIVRLSPPGVFDQDPAISPDGQRIAFASPGDKAMRLMTMAVDGSNRVYCGSYPQLGFDAPHWSPDGRRIAFTGTSTGTGETNVYTFTASGDSLRPLTTDGRSRVFAWSPDGGRILYVTGNETPTITSDTLRDVRFDGGDVRTLFPLGYGFLGADYSPDGSSIAFDYYFDAFGFTIEICDSNGMNRAVVARGSPDLEGLGQLSWAPDGSMIVFAAHIGTGSSDLYTVTPAPADPQLLLGGSAADLEPDWGPRP